MDKKLQLTEMESDALNECANVGIGNAATALSKLLQKKIEIDIPKTRFIPLEKFSESIGGAEKIVSGIYLGLEGDLRGDVIFLFPQKDAKELINLIFGKEDSTGNDLTINELEESGFKEMSNIVTGSYLNALANMLDLKIFPGVPSAATDMAQALVDSILIQIGEHSDNILYVTYGLLNFIA